MFDRLSIWRGLFLFRDGGLFEGGASGLICDKSGALLLLFLSDALGLDEFGPSKNIDGLPSPKKSRNIWSLYVI